MKYIIIVVIIILNTLNASAQYKMSAQQYINTYSPVAIEEMKHYKIPASITLAQGILESGYGGGRLAVKANNHFGIKCGSKWTGARIYHNDDERGECFRKYRSAEKSYRDHSLFLKHNQRYSKLFHLKLNDYEGWAHGLKKAGYATNPKYAPLLIELIEKYDLHKFDSGKKSKYYNGAAIAGIVGIINAANKKNKNKPENITTANNQPQTYQTNNGVEYTVAKSNENIETISIRTGVDTKKLLKYNDLYSINLVNVGDKIYLHKKKKSNGKTRYHEVTKNQTIHDIAQEYGITIKAMLKRNPDYQYKQPITGTHIYLNK